MKPEVSIVMPVLNGEKYLGETIESILDQSFTNFELIIINDGSTDRTEDIIKSYTDPRIVYIKNSSNKGLSISFNIGIRIARGDYIARMDADDISTQERLSKQITFLKEHADIDIIGSAAMLINQNGRKLGVYRRPTNHVEIKWASLFSTPLIHPTIMARADVLKDNPYDETLENSEDYELWSRLLFDSKVSFANISEPLLLYRVHPSFTQKLNTEKKIKSAENSIRNISRYTKLTEIEKDDLTLLRQEQKLSMRDLKIVWKMYARAARSFCILEKVGFVEKLNIYARLIPFGVFLLKHKAKHP